MISRLSHFSHHFLNLFVIRLLSMFLQRLCSRTSSFDRYSLRLISTSMLATYNKFNFCSHWIIWWWLFTAFKSNDHKFIDSIVLLAIASRMKSLSIKKASWLEYSPIWYPWRLKKSFAKKNCTQSRLPSGKLLSIVVVKAHNVNTRPQRSN